MSKGIRGLCGIGCCRCWQSGLYSLAYILSAHFPALSSGWEKGGRRSSIVVEDGDACEWDAMLWFHGSGTWHHSESNSIFALTMTEEYWHLNYNQSLIVCLFYTHLNGYAWLAHSTVDYDCWCSPAKAEISCHRLLRSMSIGITVFDSTEWEIKLSGSW